MFQNQTTGSRGRVARQETSFKALSYKERENQETSFKALSYKERENNPIFSCCKGLSGSPFPLREGGWRVRSLNLQNQKTKDRFNLSSSCKSAV
jgi:hypothetical protein